MGFSGTTVAVLKTPLLNEERSLSAQVVAGLMTINHPAMIGPWGPRPRPPFSAGAPAGGGGAGPRSGWKRYTRCVFGSTVMVFAPGNVSTLATTVYLSAESW